MTDELCSCATCGKCSGRAEADRLQARVKRLEDAMKYIFKETQNTGYGNAIVMERMIDRIEECAIAVLPTLTEGDEP